MNISDLLDHLDGRGIIVTDQDEVDEAMRRLGVNTESPVTGNPVSLENPAALLAADAVDSRSVDALLALVATGSFHEWDALGKHLKQEFARRCDHLAAAVAKLSSYLEHRGAAGCGDHGHDDALKSSQKTYLKVREALGYRHG